MWGRRPRVLSVGFRVFPSRGKINVNCRDLAQGRAVPSNVRDPGGPPTSVLFRLLPLSYPVRV